MPKADLVAVCDLVESRATQAAARHSVPQVYTDLDEMLEKSGIDLLVNTTHIQAHFDVNLRALKAGKHVYSEKPMTGTVQEATILIEEAESRGLKLGAAAATMLNPVNQKIQALIRNGAIGQVSFAIAHHSHSGAAGLLLFQWQTDPTWFYKPGAGPLVDLGVYGLHSLTGLLGPAKAVTCRTGISVPHRVVRTGPYKGKEIEVEMDDNTQIMLDFGDATFATLDASYCVRARLGPTMQIFGSDGTIAVHDFGAPHPFSVYRDDVATGIHGWTDMDLMSDEKRWTLPSGVEHLIECILDPEKPVVPSAEHARHVIEIMTRCYDAAREGRTLRLETTF